MTADVRSVIQASSTQWTSELAAFCEIPSEAGRPADLARAARWIASRLEAAGAEVQVIEDSPGPPLVVGEIGTGARTLTCVQHYDVVPASTGEGWTTPPYTPSIREERLFARGSNDNKGQLLTRVHGVEVYRQVLGELPCRIRFLIEGEEEIGSPHLGEKLASRPNLLAADAALIEGGTADGSGRPVVTCGVRGLLNLRMRVRALDVDAHSGWASVLEGAGWRLTHALASLRSAAGEITVDNFFDDVTEPSAAQLAAAMRDPIDVEAVRAAHGAVNHDPSRQANANMATLVPSANIAGVQVGWIGDAPKAVIPREGVAFVDFRLVPSQQPDRILHALRRHLDRRGFKDIELVVLESIVPAWTDPDAPLVRAATAAYRAALGTEPSVLPSAAGSAPMAVVCAEGGIPFVGFGPGQPDMRMHGPDENLSLGARDDGVLVFARFIDEFVNSFER